MMRQTRGTIEGPILAALPAVSSPNEFRFICEGGQLQVSINGAAYVPFAGVGATPWQQVGTVVSLQDAAVTEVAVAIAGQATLTRQFAITQTRGGPLGAGDLLRAASVIMTGDVGDDPAGVNFGLEIEWIPNAGGANAIGIFFNGVTGGDPLDTSILSDGMPLVISTTADLVRATPSPMLVELSNGVLGVVNPGSGFTITTGAGAGGAGGQGGDGAIRLGAAGVGSGARGADLQFQFNAGDGAGRGGRLRLDRVEAIPPASVAVATFDELLVSRPYGGVFLEGGAIALSATPALQNVTGAWSQTLGSRGPVTTNFATPRVQLGAVAGLWKVTWSVTFEAIDPATFTFAADFGALTVTRGSAAGDVAAGDVATLSSATVFQSFGGNEDIRLAFSSSVNADLTLLAGFFMAERIA